MKSIALAAEYCRIIEVKRIGLFYRVCNDLSVTFLDGGNIFSISYKRFFRICRNQTSIYTLCLVLILRMPPVPISRLQVAAWIVVSVPLYSELQIFVYYILF